ncbi:hypothetical protein ZIOFF_070542 [Zingiber officinale]|uniref:Uncharacterized protein n=1 Tax=Zingiber officinale TaxID=94328 RepID=A0A8J5C8P9_ZINOF|nr:hypothetical protein ZIOFF_070542 [Zingiber officinale]
MRGDLCRGILNLIAYLSSTATDCTNRGLDDLGALLRSSSTAMEGDLLSMASTQRLKLFQGSQAFPSNLHLHLLSKLGILRNLGDKESCKSNAFPTMFQGVHDPNEEKVVKSLRDTLLSKGQLPEKYDDYHTLLRYG